MKQPADSAIGGSRKSLPARKTRKVGKATPPAAGRKRNPANRKKNIRDMDVEQKLVRVFGEK